ncbi:MAG: flagellar hook-associated protein 3 [Spirochaetaceae bacterium]|nr:flagellar hook-associated protein 3 [Spirochaetaceae bacterium]
MRRVSTDMSNNDMQYYLRRQEESLNNIQNQISSGKRIRELRDDPIGASHAVRYESYLARLARYESNSLEAEERLNFTDGYLRNAADILGRIREIAVEGANGIYTKEDTANMAVEVNELLGELIDIANATGPDGKRLFAGDKAFTEPFRVVRGMVEGGEGVEMAVQVEYRGAGASRTIQIAEQSYLEMDIGGGEVFWAERMQVFPNVDATGYSVPRDSSIFIDGIEIALTQGDSAAAIAAKINGSAAAVKASIDPVTRGLNLEGTDAHMLRLEDAFHDEDGRRVQDSSVLQDLGLIKPNAAEGAPNWADGARVEGGSLFDMVIRLRDALYRGDNDYTGRQGLGGIDLAIGNLTTRLATIGSRAERANQVWQRTNQEIPNVTAMLARETGINLATAAVELGEMDLAHKASLQITARIVPQTLLDYLR